MIKIEKDYKAEAIFTEGQDTTWDKFRDKTFRVSLFGLTIYKRTEKLKIDYENVVTKKVGFREK